MVENEDTRKAPKRNDALREKLAEICYRQWPGWFQHLFEFGALNTDGTFTIDATIAREQGGEEEE